MKNFYFQFSLFLFCLFAGTFLGTASSLVADVEAPVKDRNKVETVAPKDKKEIGGKNDRPKKEDIPVNPAKPKKKNTVILPLKSEEVRNATTSLALLPTKGIQPIITNLGTQKMVGPDPFRFTITSNKDSVAIGEEIELTVTVDWVDFGVNSGVRFLPEWYKYVLKVVMPKGFLQTGGNYTDYCTKPIDTNNPQAVFTIKGKFEYTPEDAKFLVLRGFEGSDDLSGFVFKGEKGLHIHVNYSLSHIVNGRSNARITATQFETILISSTCKSNGKIKLVYDVKNNTGSRIPLANQVVVLLDRADHCSSHTHSQEVNYNGLGFKTLTNIPSTKVLIDGYWDNGKTLFEAVGDYLVIDDIEPYHPNEPFVKGIPNPYRKSSSYVYTTYFGDHTDVLIYSSSNVLYMNECVTSEPNLLPYSIVANNSTICNGESVTLTIQNCSGNVVWEHNTGISSKTIQVSPTTNTVYKATCSTQECYTAQSSITVKQKPTKPSASVSGLELTATGCSGTISWDNNAGTGSPKTVNPSVTTTYKAKCTLSGCDSDWSDGVTVTVNPPNPCSNTTLAIDATPTDATCGNSNGQIAVLGSGGTSPYQYKNGATGQYQTPVPPATNYTFTGLVAGSYTVYVKDNQGCEKSKTVSVGNANGPDEPSEYAGGSREGEGSINLTAKCDDGITETWYKVATGGTAETPTGRTFPTGTINVTTDYYVACRDITTNCESGRKKVTATINPITNVCEGTNTPSKPSESSRHRFGTGTVVIYASCFESVTRWYDSNNILKQQGSSPQDDSFTTPVINAEANNDVTVTYKASCVKTINGTECESATIDVTATVKPITDPCANTTPNNPSKYDNQIDGFGYVTLTATCSISKTEWYDASVGGNIKKTASDSNDNTYSPFLTETTTFYAACIGNNGCKSDRVSVTAIINIVSPCASSRPTAPTTTDDSREGAGAVTVRANCTTAGSTAKWYASSSSTEVLWSGSDYSTNISSTKTFYATCKNDECESNRVPATATINEISNPCAGNAPSAPSPSNGSREGAGSVSIYATCGDNITLWYASASGGSILKTASSSQDDQFNTPDISATTVFYAACVNANGCPSGRVGVIATVLPPCSTKPKAPQTSPGERTAAGSVNVYANCAHSGQNWKDNSNNQIITARLYDGSNRLITTSTQDQLTVNVNETSTFYATCYNNVTNCESDISPVEAKVNPCNVAKPSSSYTNGARCGSGTLSIAASCKPDEEAYWYNSAAGNDLLQVNDQNNSTYVIANLTASRKYYVSCRKGVCESQRQEVWAIIIPSSISTTSDVEVCEGSAINLQVTNTESFTFTGFAQPLSKTSTYQWTGPNGFVSNSQTPNIPAAALVNAGNYTAKVLNQYSHYLLNNGGPLCTATTVAQVSVYPNPATAPTLTASPVCQGKEVTITASNCISPNVVLWYNSANATTPIGNGLTLEVSVPTTATSATYYAACSANPQLACNSVKADIIITPIPAPPAPTNARVNKPNTCIGSSVTLSASCPTGQTTVWYAGNTNNDPSFTTLTFNLPSAGIYKYYVACKAGACETLPTNRAEVNVNVNPSPAAPIGASAVATSICVGDPINFNGTCSTGQTLRWYSDMGGIITNIPGTYDYYLGCQDNVLQCATPAASRVRTTININPIPATAVLTKQGEITTTSLNLFTTQSVYLETKGCENCKVEWYEKIGSTFQVIAGENTSLLFVKKFQAGTYAYKAKYMNGTCSGNFSNEITVTVNNCPDVAIKEVAPIYACGSGTTPLSISTTQIGDGVNYEWFQETQDANGYTSFTSTGVREPIFYAQKGKYIVKSCLADNQMFGQSIPLEVESFEVKATVSSANITLETGATLTLTGSDTSPITTGQTLSYLWTEPTVSSAVKTNTTLTIPNITTANQEGEYTFTVSKQVGTKICTNTAKVDVKVNPTGCTIDFIATPYFTCKKNIGEITVTTTGATSGKTIYYRINGGDWQTENIFSDLAQGQYLVELKEGTAGSTEYGSGGSTCYAISGAKIVNLDCSLLPITECSALHTEESATIKEGESLRLSATGCPDRASLIWTKVGTTTTYPNNALVSPTENTTYEAACSGISSTDLIEEPASGIASPQQTFSCQSTMQVNVIATGCENFYAGDDVTIFKGESTVLKAVNCSGTVRWVDNKGNLIGSLPNLSTPTVSPTITTTYSAFCYRGSGLQDCNGVVKITVNTNNCSAIKKFESDKKLVKTLDEKITFSHIFAPQQVYNFCTKIYRTLPAYREGTYNQEYILANTRENPNSFQISFNEIRKKVNVFHVNQTDKLMSQAELESLNTFFFDYDYSTPSGCSRQTKVKYLPYECSKFKTEPTHIITSGQQVVLSTTGCNNEITWKNITDNITLPAGNPTVSPTKTTEYTATCQVGTGASEICVVNKTIYVSCNSNELDATIANNVNCNKTLTINGCTGGIKKWMIPSVSTVMNSYTEGGVSIQYSESKSADVFVFCIKANPTESCALKLPKPIQCNAEACRNLSDGTSGVIIPVTNGLNGLKYWRGFDGKKLFDLHSDKVKLYRRTNPYLLINVLGCQNAQINWIDLKTGNTIVSGFNLIFSFESSSNPSPYTLSPSVIPTKTQDYQVECVFANGEKCSSNFTVEVKDICDDFEVTAPKTTINQSNSITLTAEVCPAANVLWNTGNPADDGKSTLTVSPSVETTYTVGCTWKDANGNNCSNKTITIGVGVDCDLFKAKTLNDAVNVGGSATLKAEACIAPATLSWSTGETANTITVYPLKNTTYTATCTLGTFSCAKNVLVKVNLEGNTADCAAFQLKVTPENVIQSGSVTLEATGYSNQDDIIWGNNLGVGSTKIVYPSDNTTYKATANLGVQGDYQRVCTRSVDVVVACNFTTTASPATLQAGSSATATLYAIGCSGKVSWYDGNNLLTGTSPVVQPTSTKTYDVVCDRGKSVCTSKVTVTVSVNNCSSFAIQMQPASTATSPAQVKFGAPVTLTYTNCTGNVTWSNGKTSEKDGKTLIFYPNESTNYTATCDATGCVAMAAVQVGKTSCDDFKVTGNTSIKVGDPANVVATGCVGTVTWDWSPRSTETMPTNPTVSTTYIAICKGTFGNLCQKNLVVNVSSAACFGVFQANIDKPLINKGENIILSTTGCVGTVTWSNGVASNTAFKPAETTEYTATCSNPVCTSKIRSIVNPTLKIKTTTKGNSVVLTVTGCETGSLLWENDLGISSIITVSPTEQTTYTATCYYTDGTRDKVSTQVIPPCIDFNLDAPQKANKFDEISMSVTGCTNGGIIKWTTDNNNSLRTTVGSYNSDRPQQTTTYTVLCEQSGCKSEQTVEISPIKLACPSLELITTTTKVNTQCTNKSVTLTATGCIGGIITWSKKVVGVAYEIPITPPNGSNTITESPTTETDYTVKCNYFGNTKVAMQKITVVNANCLYNTGQSGDPCLNNSPKAYIVDPNSDFIVTQIFENKPVKLKGTCLNGELSWIDDSNNIYNNGQIISNLTAGIYTFRARCKIDGTYCINYGYAYLDVKSFSCKEYESGGGFCAKDINPVSSKYDGLTDDPCPNNSTLWYNSESHSNSSIIKKGYKISYQEIIRGIGDGRFLYSSCTVNGLTCYDKTEIVKSCRIAADEDNLCANDQVPFRTMMKGYIQQFLTEFDKKNGNTAPTDAQGQRLANCIINQLKANTNFMKYQGTIFSPNVTTLGSAFLSSGSTGFNNALETSFLDIQIKQSEYNADIQTSYEMFKKDVLACVFPNTTGPEELKIDNPYRCNVSSKSINFEGKTVFVGFDGKSIDITAQGIPVSFYGAEQIGHEGQLASFMLGNEFYVAFTDINDNFIYYGYTNASPHGANKDLVYTSQIKRYTVTGGTSATPVLLKTNSFGYYVLDNGLESHEVKNVTGQTVLSDCRFAREDKCEFNSDIAQLIHNKYSQASKEKIFKMYNSVGTDSYGAPLSYWPPLSITFPWVSICKPEGYPTFSQFIQKREIEINRIKAKTCNLWSQNELNIMLMEDLLDATPTCKAQLITKIASKTLGFGCDEQGGCEGVILELLKSGKGTESALLAALKTETSIEAIEKGLDDANGEDNYTKAINILLDLSKVAFKNNYNKTTVKETIVLGKLALGSYPNEFYNYGKLGDGFDLTGNTISVGKIDVFEPKVETYSYTVDPSPEIRYASRYIKADEFGANQLPSTNTRELDIYDPVSIAFTENVSFLEDVGGANDIPTGIVPAFYIRYLKRKQQTELYEKRAINTAIVASYALGIGELATALRVGSTARAFFAVSDIGSAIFTDVTSTEDFVNFLVENYNLGATPQAERAKALEIQSNCQKFGLVAQLGTAAGSLRLTMKTQAANEALDAMDDYARAARPVRDLANKTEKAKQTNLIVKGWIEKHLQKLGKRARILFSDNSILSGIIARINRSTNVTDFIAELSATNQRIIKISRRTNSVPIAQLEDNVLRLEKTTSPIPAIELVDATGSSTALRLEEVAEVEIDGIRYAADDVELTKSGASAKCGANGIACFVAGTPVKVGNVSKPIESFELNDVISTFDHKTSQNTLSRVTKLFKKEVKKLAKVVIGGAMIIATLEHPFFANGRYTPVKELQKGDSILTQSGKQSAVEGVSFIDSTATVYNLEVAEQHNYFIGEAGLLVHNKCLITSLTQKLGTEWNKLQNTLITLNVPLDQRVALYKAIDALDGANIAAPSAKLFIKDFLADTKFAKGIIQDVDLVDVWKNVKYLTTSRDNIEFLGWVKTLKDRVNPQGKKLYEHIFVGKTGGTNGISGIHHSSALNTNIRIRPGTKVMKSDGFYEGIIEYYDGTTWIPKTENGTIIPNGFFPDAWDADKIMEEVAFARNKITINDWIQPIPPKSRSNIFESILSNGQKVQFYLGQQVSVRPANLNNHSYIITVFPKF